MNLNEINEMVEKELAERAVVRSQFYKLFSLAFKQPDLEVLKLFTDHEFLDALEKELKNARSDDFNKYAKEEAKTLWKLYKNGIVREFYFRDDETKAVLILEAEDPGKANELLNKLPFVKNKLIEFELIPLRPYPGFERLFAL